MKAYTIGYDLDKPGQNYEKLIARLKQHGAVRILLSQWALQTTWSAVQLRDDLRTYTDSNDRILVAGLTAEWASWNLMATDQFKQIAA
jgi:hypothetical protein